MKKPESQIITVLNTDGQKEEKSNERKYDMLRYKNKRFKKHQQYSLMELRYHWMFM